MGTTAEKLKYLNETKAEIKNALETPYNVMRDYPELIKKYIDNQPTKVVTDGMCGNAVDVPVKTIETNGNIRQETTEGYNLLNIESKFKVTGSERIPISLPAGEYTIKADNIVTDSSSQTSFVTSFRTSSEAIADVRLTLSNHKLKFTLLKPATFAVIYSGNSFNESQGVTTTYTNLMIYEGTSDKPYEPYTGGISSPNPDYPQEIETINSIGLEQSGKNKFDNFKEYSYSNSNLNTTSINNGIKIEKKGGFGLWVFDNLENLDGKIVRAKSKFNDGGSIAIGLASLNGTSRTVMKENTKSNTVSSFVIPKITDDKKYLAVWLYGLDNSEISYEDLIITIDNEDITYEPYHEPKVITIDLQGNTLGKVGDVKDILKVNRNGEVEIKKNIGKVVLDGSNDEKYIIATSNKFILDKNCDKGKLFKDIKNDNTKITAISNKLTGIPWDTMNDLRQGWYISIRQDGPFSYLRLLTTDIETGEDLKLSFQEHPAEVYYELATPQIITLPSISPIELWQGTNIFSLVTNLDTDFEVEYVVDKDSVTKEEE